ncbi:hypothetical protein SAV14893_078010 [Streptomyces avermitilis]|uniref:Uncharacterized protein n=1 Tax=Streptomyces avermitilis TaxID=33903 RepID=A0A4D4M988_STRAX|nr:hypothetical protein SAV14893_078010 [Streptomyces avermitilis]GDY71219.1 hypothetical protein SAV31267_007040 [Streptomyces avermitilis]
MIESLPNSRRGHHHMDLARAWLWDGNHDKSLKELEKAELIAPQLVRHHPIARSTLRSIVYADRATTREKLRHMSDRSTSTDEGRIPAVHIGPEHPPSFGAWPTEPRSNSPRPAPR